MTKKTLYHDDIVLPCFNPFCLLQSPPGRLSVRVASDGRLTGTLAVQLKHKYTNTQIQNIKSENSQIYPRPSLVPGAHLVADAHPADGAVPKAVAVLAAIGVMLLQLPEERLAGVAGATRHTRLAVAQLACRESRYAEEIVSETHCLFLPRNILQGRRSVVNMQVLESPSSSSRLRCLEIRAVIG